jgi:fatty-acyl-CoA synthase
MELWDALTRETFNHGRLHCWDGSAFQVTTWAEVVADARRIASALRRRHGVGPGSRVGTVLSNSGHAVRGVLGVWLAGGAVVSLPVPARGMDFAE